MKLYLIALIGLIFGIGILATPITINVHSQPRQHLLGAKECTWGPSYWCSNIKNAKSCHAVTHCIQTVWETHSTYPVDNDSICKICLDMVTQARDQLNSNETQDDLKAVFEGSCNLIPIKVVRHECDKLVDDFVPELIETLTSQMDPNTVCSVAGLCNNVEIDKLLAQEPQHNLKIEDSTVHETKLSCENCNQVGKQIELKFQSKNRDEILEGMLAYCGTLSSLSDGCSNIILTYFNEIYNHLKENLIAENICHMSGTCSANFHKHDEDKIELEIRPMSGVGVVSPLNDDIPCELCEQLMTHLRDLLIANTTEAEFKTVLEGLCNQTQAFAKECLSIVDQYYDVIYNTLVQNLDAEGACYMIGICNKKGQVNGQGLIMPLVPSETVRLMEKVKYPTPPKKLLGQDEPVLTNEQINNMQLPIDRLLGAPNSMLLAQNGEWCTICEYFWHFVQETMASPKTEEDIKRVVSETCDKMPKSINSKCHDFVNMYGDAIIALIIQNINPAELCPELKLCPSVQEDMEVFSPFPVEINTDFKNDKPQCPLCLFAVTEAIEKVRSDKSKQNIERVLSKLCSQLPPKLQPQCTDFIDTYSKELIEMLATDFTPEQICVYFKCCNDTKPDNSLIEIQTKLFREIEPLERYNKIETTSEESNDILTNEIADNTINGQIISTANIEYQNNPECSLCTQILLDVEKRIVNKKSKEQIKYALEHACDKMRKAKSKCLEYVKAHEDRIIDLMINDFAPKEICRQLMLCTPLTTTDEADDMSQDLDVDEALLVSIVASPADPIIISSNDPRIYPQVSDVKDGPQCVLCEFVMQRLEKELADKKTQEEIKDTVKNICKKLPKTVSTDCQKFVNQYADLVINLLATLPPKQICSQMMLCQQALKLESEVEVIECAVCQGAVIALDKIIADPKTDEDIENVLEKTCEELPAKYYKRCTDLVNVYGQSMINLLKRFAEPQKICSEIGMCYPSDFNGLVQIEPISN